MMSRKSRVEDVAMTATDPPGNLVRDPGLGLRWARPATGDGWYRVSREGATAWQGEPVPVQGGRRYRLRVRWKPGATGAATLFWDATPPQHPGEGTRLHHYYPRKTAASPKREPGEAERTFTAPEGTCIALILFEGPQPPGLICQSVGLAPDP
jgi:hypothetical protein